MTEKMMSQGLEQLSLPGMESLEAPAASQAEAAVEEAPAGAQRVKLARVRVSQDFDVADLRKRWEVVAQDEDLARGRFQLRPGGFVSAIAEVDGERRVEALRWGLVPFWTPAEDVRAGRRAVWARAETLAKRASFRQALAGQRCIVPISGFFVSARDSENSGQGRTLLIRPRGGGLWPVAALWDEWVSSEGNTLRTLALVSVESNARLAKVEGRMPAILRPGEDAAWLGESEMGEKALARVLRPWSGRDMDVCAVRSPRWKEQDDAGLVEPLHASEAIVERMGLGLPPREQKFRRQIVRDVVSSDGQVFFKVRSFTRDDGARWHPVVDTQDGGVFCDCPDFHFRHARHAPSVATPDHWCKHVQRAVRNCLQHGELQRASVS
jgi:putative SOS response-associated peptidase YedK